MNLISMEIKNCKSHRHTILSNIGLFNCLIGANSTGKTSILEVAQLLRSRCGEQLKDAIEIVNGSVIGNETKSIEFIFCLDLLQEEQRSFYKYLNLPDEDEIRTIMKQVRLTLSINVSRNESFGIENHLLLTGMDISDTDNKTFIPILNLIDKTRMKIGISDFNTKLLEQGEYLIS
jgi:predicted ATPase